jgi:hypothetical protein
MKPKIPNHDSAYKQLFRLPGMVSDLLKYTAKGSAWLEEISRSQTPSQPFPRSGSLGEGLFSTASFKLLPPVPGCKADQTGGGRLGWGSMNGTVTCAKCIVQRRLKWNLLRRLNIQVPDNFAEVQAL